MDDNKVRKRIEELEKAPIHDELVQTSVRSAFKVSGRTYDYRHANDTIISETDGETMSVLEWEVCRTMGVAGMIFRPVRR